MTQPLNPEELEALQAVCDAAHPEWRRHGATSIAIGSRRDGWTYGNMGAVQDAIFAEQARIALPRAVATIQALWAELDRQERVDAAEIDRLKTECARQSASLRMAGDERERLLGRIEALRVMVRQAFCDGWNYRAYRDHKECDYQTESEAWEQSVTKRQFTQEPKP